MDLNEILHSGKLYIPTDASIMEEQLKRLDRLYDFNHTRPTEQEKRQAMLKEMFAEIGENCYIEPPFHSNWGGMNVHFGSNIYCNFNTTLVDDTHIYVGDNTMFGPNVTVATAGHPINAELRRKEYQYNAPVTIGKNCWIGAGVLIMPGVTIGDNLSSVRVVLSQRIFHQMWSLWAILVVSLEKWVKKTISTISRIAKSIGIA